jgi:hypothetical protein
MDISSSGYCHWELTFSGDLPDVRMPFSGYSMRARSINFQFRQLHGGEPRLHMIRLNEAQRVRKDGTPGARLYGAALSPSQVEDDVLELARRVLDAELLGLRAGYSSSPRLPGMDVLRLEGLPGWPRP